jgi:LEA14-like dessication related protein
MKGKIPKNMMRIGATALMAMTITGCDVVQQAQQAVNLTNCDFRILSVQNIMVAGINVQNYKSIKDLSITDLSKVTVAATKPTFPLSLQLNLEGRNPNASSAGLNKIDYILFIDNIQMTAGSLLKSFVIPPNNGTTVIPLQLSVDLKQALQGKSLDAIMNFGFNLAGVGNKPTRITIKLKPTILIGPTELVYPGYITVGTEFGS